MQTTCYLLFGNLRFLVVMNFVAGFRLRPPIYQQKIAIFMYIHNTYVYIVILTDISSIFITIMKKAAKASV